LRILFVSLLCEGKGLLVLLDACGRLAKRGVPFQLNLMGPMESDEFAKRVRLRIAELQIGDSVTLLGIRTGAEKFAYFAASDVLCHPTYYDTFPLVLLEAMAASLPVLATNHSGIPDIVDDGETGFLVEPRDPLAVAERLEQLASDCELRAALGAAGRRKYLRKFALERHVERVRDVLVDVAGVTKRNEGVCSIEAAPEIEPAEEELVTV
jgi:glycosyltransferase involved in cell wall biosynthesis